MNETNIAGGISGNDVMKELPERNDVTDRYSPARVVQELLISVDNLKYRARTLFCQLDSLKKRGEEYEWRQRGRWVKYEETVEEGGKRWSKPHVASLSIHYFMELRRHLVDGIFLKDIEAYSIAQIIDFFLYEWIRTGTLDSKLRPHMKAIAMKHHRHRHQRGRPDDKRTNNGPNSGVGRDLFKHTNRPTTLNSPVTGSALRNSPGAFDPIDNKRYNARFMRKLPKGSETANIMIGEVEDLQTTVCGFMRLNDAQVIPDLCEVELPTRFIVYILGPSGSGVHLKQMGRCMATMMVDDIFREVAYKSRSKDDLLAGVDEFLEQATMLPPGQWDPKIRIEPPETVPPQENRKFTPPSVLMEKTHGVREDDEADELDPDLILTLRPFSGLITDVEQKLPWYWSDVRDAIHVQCLPAIIFIFLTTLANDVVFGAMMAAGTGNNIGVMECIFAGGFSCVFFAIFGGQPLNIIAGTGPLLILEKIIYQLSSQFQWDFLAVRFWVGMWTSLFLLMMVILNLSALVRYITRFTQETYACLIAVIFIYDAFVMLSEIFHHDEGPVRHQLDATYFSDCFCNISANGTRIANTITNGVNHSNHLLPLTSTSGMSMILSDMTGSLTTTFSAGGRSNISEHDCHDLGEQWACADHSEPNIAMFLMSCIVFATTFFLAIFLVHFRTWPCFPTSIRAVIGEFALIIAILLSVALDAAIGIHTPKLSVPSEFKPSIERPWVLNPISPLNPWWLYIGTSLPALLAALLIFMDQQITSVIINRKENKLIKGKGYHLDLLNIVIITAVHSLFGLPWYVAETVNGIAHVNALKVESECAAPGERPAFLGVREQRVTLLIIGVLIFLSVLITPILNIIPVAVLYGVFFYMGYVMLTDMEFVDRMLLALMPVKFQPDYPYLRHVPLWRVHFFTFIQFLCLVAMVTIKFIESVSILFPLFFLLAVVVRKVMEVNFSQEELKHLDSRLPHNPKKVTDEKVDDDTIIEVICDTDDLYKIVNEYGEGCSVPSIFPIDVHEPSPAQDNTGCDVHL